MFFPLRNEQIDAQSPQIFQAEQSEKNTFAILNPSSDATTRPLFIYNLITHLVRN